MQIIVSPSCLGSQSFPFPPSQSHPPPAAQLSLCHSLILCVSHRLARPFQHTHKHTHTHAQTPTQSFSLSVSLCYTHTHTSTKRETHSCPSLILILHLLLPLFIFFPTCPLVSLSLFVLFSTSHVSTLCYPRSLPTHPSTSRPFKHHSADPSLL